MPKELISDQLRKHLIDQPASLYALAEKAGVSRWGLTRFAGGKSQNLSMTTIDAVAQALGLRLVQTRRPKRKAR